jgi:hypothetical protein
MEPRRIAVRANRATATRLSGVSASAIPANAIVAPREWSAPDLSRNKTPTTASCANATVSVRRGRLALGASNVGRR